MCSSAVPTASRSGSQIGASECGTQQSPWPASADLHHDLRHTAASLAIASGASVKHIQRLLGHKDAAMTLNVYATLFEGDLDDVSNRPLTRPCWKRLRPVCGLSPRQRSSNCLSGLPEHRFH
jgi:hypothetical protein